MKKILSIIILTFILTLIFASCSHKNFTDSLTCKDLSLTLKREISVPSGEFEEYSTDELNFLFTTTELYDDICVIYSSDTTDICELGIIHATNEENAKKLFEDSKNYIKSIQEQKSEFLRNYSPDELKKLNSAEARRFGNYVIFIVSEKDDRDTLLKKAEALLSK